MQSNSEIFLEEREAQEADEVAHEQYMNEQARQIPVIDIEELRPSGEIIKMQFGEKIEILSTTSSDIANNIIENILDGFMDVKDFLVKKKLIIDALEIVSKNERVKKHAVDEVEKLKGQKVLGAKISLIGRATYQYESDPKCKELIDQIKPLETKLKAQQELVKICCKTGHSIVNEETGEMIATVVPAPSTTSIAVSFSKK